VISNDNWQTGYDEGYKAGYAAAGKGIAEAIKARKEADNAKELSTMLAQETILKLRSEGFSMRDIAGMLKISHQRVSQLLHDI
jgi:DNA-binding NarL/FixJ family response regulator